MESFIITDKYLIKFYYSLCNYMVSGVFSYRTSRCDGPVDKRTGKHLAAAFNPLHGSCGTIPQKHAASSECECSFVRFHKSRMGCQYLEVKL